MKAILALAIGVAAVLALKLFQRNKTRQLEQKKRQEWEEEQKKQEELEAIWMSS